jgi:hypothetical protein
MDSHARSMCPCIPNEANVILVHKKPGDFTGSFPPTLARPGPCAGSGPRFRRSSRRAAHRVPASAAPRSSNRAQPPRDRPGRRPVHQRRRLRAGPVRARGSRWALFASDEIGTMTFARPLPYLTNVGKGRGVMLWKCSPTLAVRYTEPQGLVNLSLGLARIHAFGGSCNSSPFSPC